MVDQHGLLGRFILLLGHVVILHLLHILQGNLRVILPQNACHDVAALLFHSRVAIKFALRPLHHPVTFDASRCLLAADLLARRCLISYFPHTYHVDLQRGGIWHILLSLHIPLFVTARLSCIPLFTFSCLAVLGQVHVGLTSPIFGLSAMIGWNCDISLLYINFFIF